MESQQPKVWDCSRAKDGRTELHVVSASIKLRTVSQIQVTNICRPLEVDSPVDSSPLTCLGSSDETKMQLRTPKIPVATIKTTGQDMRWTCTACKGLYHPGWTAGFRRRFDYFSSYVLVPCKACINTRITTFELILLRKCSKGHSWNNMCSKVSFSFRESLASFFPPTVWPH